MIEVVTVWAPRPSHPKWRDDYIDIMALQKATAEHFGHAHTVVTDAELSGFETLRANLSPHLMPAMLDGVLARLHNRDQQDRSLVLVDADVLIARDLAPAFASCNFELGLTRRVHDKSPINNGAMFVLRGAQWLAADFFQKARDRCGTHWGADQEAISAVAAPVPVDDNVVELRGPLRVGFLCMKQYAAVPKERGKRHHGSPFTVHFKGDTKRWAREYAQRFIFGD